MRRLALMFMLIAPLTGCSSGSSTDASSSKSTSPTAASPASATEFPAAPTTTAQDATSYGFCAAFNELQNAKTTDDPVAFGTALQEGAAQMRKWSPPEIKDAAGTYADVMEIIGTAAQGGTMDEAAMQKALSAGLAGKASDIAKVAVWVGTNCKV